MLEYVVLFLLQRHEVLWLACLINFEYRRVHKRYEAPIIGPPKSSQPAINKETEYDDNIEKGKE
jgi:hypothetical protein